MENIHIGEKSIRTISKTLIVVVLELMRILFIMLFLVGFLSSFVGYVYLEIGTDVNRYGWMTYIAFIIMIFVLYSNKLQFNGWYKGKGRKKLPKTVSRLLICTSVVLFFLPPILS